MVPSPCRRWSGIAAVILWGLALEGGRVEAAESTPVPDLVGKSAQDAKKTLEVLGLVTQFQVGRAATTPSDAFKVLEVAPRPGTVVAKGSTVRVTIAGQPPAAQPAPARPPPAGAAGTVPNMSGLTASEARAALVAAGLTAKFQLGQRPPLVADALRVYGSEPAAGSKLARGAEVRVTIYADATPAERREEENLPPELSPAALPPEVAKSVAELQARGLEWIKTPPKNLTRQQLDRQFADLWWSIAKQLAPHDIPGAISFARAAVNIDEAHASRWEQLGDLYNFSGELTSARDAANAYDNALFLQPTRHTARLKLASAYLMNRQPEQALRHLELYLCVTEKNETSEVIPLYAAACAAAGEFQRGIAFCQARAETEEDHRYRMAWAILEKASGNRAAAIRLLTEVESKAGAESPLAIHAAKLRKSYEASKGDSK